MTPVVLTDFHHHALAESLLRVFEDRYGGSVWFPKGMEWFEQGVWNFERKFHGDRVARQYLEGIWHDAEGGEESGLWYRHDPRHPGRVQQGIELETARSMGFDLVIASLPDNDEGFAALARQTGARFGVQVGNNLQQSRWDLAEFILSSSTLDGFGPEWIGKQFTYRGVPAVMYHQEFDTETFRHEWPPAEPRTVASFVNCFPEGPSYPDFAALARAYREEFDFKVYGACGTPGPDEFTAADLSRIPDVADAMRAARIGWHSKHWSDGFGHVIHNWGAVGRPVIGYEHYYHDKLAAPLWEDGVTTFDLGRRSVDSIVAIMRRLRDDDDYHRTISENMARRFREVVDYDAEADTIARMLGIPARVAVAA